MHALFFLCLVVAAVGALPQPQKDTFFGDDDDDYEHMPIERAPYTVIKETENYEVRSYGTVKWICSHKTGSMADKRQKKKNMMRMFYAIFEYMNGKNSAEADLDMTTPMTMQMNAIKEDEYEVKMCNYIPTALQADPPTPLDQDVIIDTRKDFKVAVRTFNGFMTKMREWKNQASTLIRDLKESDEPGCDFTKVYGAMYKPNKGTRTMNNEVWVQMA